MATLISKKSTIHREMGMGIGLKNEQACFPWFMIMPLGHQDGEIKQNDGLDWMDQSVKDA